MPKKHHHIAAASLLGATLAMLPLNVTAQGIGQAGGAEPGQALFEEVLRHPDSREANTAFAEQAEAEGNPRHAIAAYERLLHADPGNAHARREFNRLRAELSPNTTSLHASLSTRGHGAMLANSATRNRDKDATLDGVFSLRDDRTLSGRRWRSDVYGGFRAHADFDELSELRLGGVTGPVWQVVEGVRLHVAAGGEARYLDNDLFYSQAISRLTLDFLSGGTRQSLSASLAGRFLGDDKFATAAAFARGAEISDRALVVELKGKLSFHDGLRPGDAFFIRPRARYIDINGAHQNVIFDDSLLFQDLKEIGTRVAYYLPLGIGDLYVGAGMSFYYRDFSMPVTGGTQERHDFFFEPSAHVVMSGVLGDEADLRLDYRYKHNRSNDAGRDYNYHVLGLKFVRRF